VTQAANRVYELAARARAELPGRDTTGPTIFPPWLLPENPGGKAWGQGGLVDAPRVGVLHTFVCDVSTRVRIRRAPGRARRHTISRRSCPPAPATFATSSRPPTGAATWLEARSSAPFSP